VLVVDDDAGVRDLVCDILEAEGYAVAWAHDGAAALEAIARSPEARPDVILLDLHMPLMDGAEFARRYRQTPGPHAAVLLLTVDDGALADAAELGINGRLAKPFDVWVLIEAVGRSVGRRRSEAGG
jgi:CheY-like chemotaxis protein